MSGSGSNPSATPIISSQGQGGGIAATGTDPCANLIVRTVLNSPKAAVLARLKTGDVLTVQLRSPEQNVVVVLHDGQEAGSVTFANIVQLINCLKAGHPFVAEVISVEGGRCEVRVRPGSQK